MRSRLAFATALAGVLAVAACVDSEVDKDDPTIVDPDKTGDEPDEDVDPDDPADPVSEDVQALASPEMCMAVADDGPCAYACDPDAVIERFIPPGTCAIFVCEMQDGSTARIGGCRE